MYFILIFFLKEGVDWSQFSGCVEKLLYILVQQQDDGYTFALCDRLGSSTVNFLVVYT